jgi:hypothetical protein
LDVPALDQQLEPALLQLNCTLERGQLDQITSSDVSVRQPIHGGAQLAGFATLVNRCGVARST